MQGSREGRVVEKRKRARKKDSRSQEVMSFKGEDASQTQGMSQAWQEFYARVKAAVAD